MSCKIKKAYITLSDNFSPLIQFINARKDLKNIYNTEKKSKTLDKIKNINNKKNYKIKTRPKKLLQDQIFILSRFSKTNSSNYYNNGYSILNTFGNRNYYKEKDMIANLKTFSKFSNNTTNIFKTTALNNSKEKLKPIIKQKSNYEYDYNKINLPKLNLILRKNIKIKKLYTQ